MTDKKEKINFRGFVTEALLFKGTSNRLLIDKFLDSLGELSGDKRIDFEYIDYDIFADGESSDKFPNFKNFSGKNAVYFYPIVPGDKLEFHVKKLTDHCRSIKYRYGAQTLSLVLPFVPFRRQDHPEKVDEIPRLEYFLTDLKNAGVDHLITVTPHSNEMKSICGRIDLKFHPIDLSLTFALAIRPYLRVVGENKKIRIFAPDLGSIPRAIALAKCISGAEVIYCLQVRSNGWEKKIQPADEKKISEIKDRFQFEHLYHIEDDLVRDAIIIIVEDEVSTGGTANDRAHDIVRCNPAAVYLMFTHAVCSPGWKGKLLKGNVFDKIFASDSIERDELKRTGGRICDVTTGRLFAEEVFFVLSTLK